MLDEKMLDAQIEELERRIGVYEDRHEIEMVMGHYVLRDNPRNMKKIWSFLLWIRKMFLLNGGIWEGLQEQKRFVNLLRSRQICWCMKGSTG